MRGSTQQPQLKDLVTIKVVEWYDLGLQLDIHDDELDVIQKDHRGDIRACRREMFKAWLKSFPTATYQQLVQALLNIGENREACRISKRCGEIVVVAKAWYMHVPPSPHEHCCRKKKTSRWGSL